jgi:uncharacterized protein (TIGR02118 family)
MMILSVIYPHHDGARFDADYYRSTHAPLAMEVLKADSATLIEAVPMPGAASAPFAFFGHFHFASAEALQAALTNPRMAELQADVANFTDIQPVITLGRAL